MTNLYNQKYDYFNATLSTYGVTAEAEIETAKVKRLYDQRISLAEGNNYKVTKLEKKKEAIVAKIKNEAEKRKYKMEVISAIASTTQGTILGIWYSSNVAHTAMTRMRT